MEKQEILEKLIKEFFSLIPSGRCNNDRILVYNITNQFFGGIPRTSASLKGMFNGSYKPKKHSIILMSAMVEGLNEVMAKMLEDSKLTISSIQSFNKLYQTLKTEQDETKL